jgi:O-antigen ligase
MRTSALTPPAVAVPAARAAPWLLPAGVGLCSVAATIAGLQVMAVNPRVGPILVGGAAVGIALAWRPAWIVPAFLALTWCSIETPVFGGLPSPVETGGMVLLGAVGWRSLSRTDAARPPLLIAALLAAPAVASALLSGEGMAHLDELRDLSFLFIAALGLRTVVDVRRATIALAAVGIILGAGAAWSVLVHGTTLFPVVTEEAVGAGALPRAAGPFGEPNFFALSMAALIPIALLNVAAGGARRLLGAASVVALLAGVLATGSRGALLASGVGITAMALVAGGARTRVAAVAAIVTVAALLPLFATQARGSEGRTVSGRATENRIALSMFADHPLTGVGPGRYPGLYRDYARRIGNDRRSGRASHSLPLQIAAEQGVAGLVGWATALAVALGTVLRRGAWQSVTGRALLIATATYLVGSLFLHGSQLRLPFVLAGMALALSAATPERA